MSSEADPVPSQMSQKGARLALVSIGAQPICAQCIDQDEQDIHVVPGRKSGNVGGGSLRTGIPLAQVDGSPEEEHYDEQGRNDVGPRL